jgi:hypothetical protein
VIALLFLTMCGLCLTQCCREVRGAVQVVFSPAS